MRITLFPTATFLVYISMEANSYLCIIKSNLLNKITMGLFDYIFKSKKEREQNTRVKDALKKAKETIKRIEAGIEKMKKDDETWKKIIGY